MKKIVIGLLIICLGLPAYVSAKEEPAQLYAQSAVLMDADSGRVLFEKNGKEVRPMASTTKIMTCILALENSKDGDVATASGEASAQPKVHLGMVKGEQFLLKDLLYSLMLESHNDSAVAIAEQIGGTVEGFANLMNEKARKIGCSNTHFVSPNGLDSFDEEGKHSTTAEDLARIMRYCITKSPKRDEFLEITRASSYSFQDVEKKRNFSCNNHNAFLKMMDGALSGKTGFTGEAGYCYVGSLKRDDRTFIVSLLACGWPNNKSYKWADTRKLMEYAIDNYRYEDVYEAKKLDAVPVPDGVPKTDIFSGRACTKLCYKDGKDGSGLKALMSEDETVDVRYDLPESLPAPVKKGQSVGAVRYYLGGKLLKEYEVVAAERVKKRTAGWCFGILLKRFLPAY